MVDERVSAAVVRIEIVTLTAIVINVHICSI